MNTRVIAIVAILYIYRIQLIWYLRKLLFNMDAFIYKMGLLLGVVVVPIEPKSAMEQYVEKYKSIFLYNVGVVDAVGAVDVVGDSASANRDGDEKDGLRVANRLLYNVSIGAEYYNKVLMLSVILKDRDNAYEKLWRSRILMVNTPVGNVVMNYNLYSRGFTYYADTKDIHYNILNVVCMRYVITYRCLDFFIDNIVLKGWKSPYWEIWEKDDKKVGGVVGGDAKGGLVGGGGGDGGEPYLKRLPGAGVDDAIAKKVIAKFKNNSRLIPKAVAGGVGGAGSGAVGGAVGVGGAGGDGGVDDSAEYNKNHFIYGGKMIDMPAFKCVSVPIKKPPKEKKMSYDEFKAKMSGGGGLGDVGEDFTCGGLDADSPWVVPTAKGVIA